MVNPHLSADRLLRNRRQEKFPAAGAPIFSPENRREENGARRLLLETKRQSRSRAVGARGGFSVAIL
jgi:hypothetical protein